jgi:NADPH:quinone reductase
MRAIIVTKHGGPEVLEIQTIANPTPGPNDVLINVNAFGLNHADTFMRQGLWPFNIPVIGIECAGSVEHDPSGTLEHGTKVIALVGGMARDRNGSYAEMVSVPSSNVVPVETKLNWAELGAIPEVYATAWIALHGNLAIQPGQTILVRGGTSSVGQAAINIAVDAGATVIATTRSEERIGLLNNLGASEVLIDDGNIADQIRTKRPEGIDGVLDLIGNTVLRDSLSRLKAKGRICQIGFLGGLLPVQDFNPIADLPSGVQLSVFGSAFVLGTAAFPISDVPFQDIIAKVERGIYKAKPTRVFAFENIVEAHQVMEANHALGKMVVLVNNAA